jgi:hypothetical protein
MFRKLAFEALPGEEPRLDHAGDLMPTLVQDVNAVEHASEMR